MSLIKLLLGNRHFLNYLSWPIKCRVILISMQITYFQSIFSIHKVFRIFNLFFSSCSFNVKANNKTKHSKNVWENKQLLECRSSCDFPKELSIFFLIGGCMPFVLHFNLFYWLLRDYKLPFLSKKFQCPLSLYILI